MKSLDDCGMGAWIKKQNKGLSQELFRVNEDGINVSGGESQKLAIARALYFNRPFIIMDEPTAALDPVSESEIYEKFHMLAKGKGAVYISHRLSSCRFCNKISRQKPSGWLCVCTTYSMVLSYQIFCDALLFFS